MLGALDPLLLDVPEVMAALKLSRTAVYGEMASGRLRSIKAGRRRLVPHGALVAYVELLTAEENARRHEASARKRGR